MHMVTADPRCVTLVSKTNCHGLCWTAPLSVTARAERLRQGNRCQRAYPCKTTAQDTTGNVTTVVRQAPQKTTTAVHGASSVQGQAKAAFLAAIS